MRLPRPAASGNERARAAPDRPAGPLGAGSQARNAGVVRKFNRGEAGIGAADVLRNTTAAIGKCKNDWQAAIACLRALGQCARPLPGGRMERVEPNIFVFSAAISACGKAGKVDKALELFEEMKDLGIRPNAFTYTALMSAYGNAGQPAEALEWFKEMKDRGIRPDAFTYSALISAYGNAGQPVEALEWFKDMLDRGIPPNAITFSALISAYGNTGQPVEALKWFEEMRSRGLSLDTIGYDALLWAYGNAGQPGEALKWFQEMRDRGIPPDTGSFNALMSAYRKAGQPAEALEWFEEMRDRGIPRDIVTYTLLISACETAGMRDKVSELLGKGIEDGIFKPTLGFVRESNELNLHESAVLTQADDRAARDKGVSALVAKGIFRRLLGQQAITHETLFVVGQRGSDVVKNAIADCMREQNWTAEHPRDPRGREDRGCLRAAALPPQPAATGGTRTSLLNPHAAEFWPSAPFLGHMRPWSTPALLPRVQSPGEEAPAAHAGGGSASRS
jgi:pentatricopeptide repeat protein